MYVTQPFIKCNIFIKEILNCEKLSMWFPLTEINQEKLLGHIRQEAGKINEFTERPGFPLAENHTYLFIDMKRINSLRRKA